MTTPIIIFEDHSAQDFRPLGWSVPVYEIRCGLFNLRERVQILAAEGAPESRRPLAVLARGLLQPLQEMTGLPGMAARPDAVAEILARTGDALWLNARVGPGWPLLEVLLTAARAGSPGWIWLEGESVVAAHVGVSLAREWLDRWREWEQSAAGAGCWTTAGKLAPPWGPGSTASTGAQCDLGAAGRLVSLDGRSTEELARQLSAARDADRLPGLLHHLWDVVPAMGAAITADCGRVVSCGRAPARLPFGIVPDEAQGGSRGAWTAPSRCERVASDFDSHAGTRLLGGEAWLDPGAVIEPGVVLDARAGPIVIERAVRVEPHCYLQGPLYLGPGSIVKAGARIYGETSIGAVCRVAGEIGESLFADFVNKQHDGFIGHAVLGSWSNLGAGTTCSDLKNNYGPVRADCGLGERDTGLRFLGLMMAEHAKSAIGTMFNTATTVGFASNVFGAGFPPKFLPNFTWGDPTGPPYEAAKAAVVARTVMARRGCRFTAAHEQLFLALARDS